MAEGYITYTRGATGAWIAWYTLTRPPAEALGRDIAATEGPVLFAIGASPEDALARLRAEHPASGLDP